MKITRNPDNSTKLYITNAPYNVHIYLNIP